VPVLIAAVIGLALYIAACYVAVLYLLIPIAPWVLVTGAGAGALLVVGVLLGTLLAARGLAPATVTAAQAGERLPAVRSAHGRDCARPHYLFAQSRDDLRAAVKNTLGTVGAIWAALGTLIAGAPPVLLAWPLLAIPVAAAAALTLGALGFGLAVYSAVGATLGAAWVCWLLTVGVLRGWDRTVRRARGAWATCPHSGCNFRTRLPAYRCRRCVRVHHDIRAGRLGALSRECACGLPLPTTVLRAAAELVAVCPMCVRPLREGAAVLTDVVLPVFGPVSAGKTRFVLAAMVALGRQLVVTGGKLAPVGAESQQVFRHATELVERREQTTKTDADRPPAAITVRLRNDRRTAALHLFDAAGEWHADRELTSSLHYLDRADGLVFVLDPFSIPEVADQLRGAHAARLAEAQPARTPPGEAYELTAQRLADHRARQHEWPLAVAVVKADLLLGLPPAAGLEPAADSDRVRKWLLDSGLDNTVTAAERDFAAVRYFLVSSMELDQHGECSPAAPLRWLLARAGAPLPDPAPAATP
jgi:Double-GTPase 2